jgi:hypothetical protein
MGTQVLWKSPAIPERAFESDKAMQAVVDKVSELQLTDTPSSSDLRSIFYRYNESSEAERDAIDAAFVWMTGYTLATITVSKDGDYGRVLERWRRRGAR